MADWTIKKLLNWITGYFEEKKIDSPRLTAELLLRHVLGISRIELYTKFDLVVGKNQLDELHKLVKRAGEHEPVRYIVGKTEFYSLTLDIDKNCLIPRPETELLVEKAIEYLRSQQGEKTVCDLCTGSGCIAVAIAKNHTDTRIIATDISDGALSVANRNVENHNLSERVQLLCGDLFDPIIKQLDVEKFDLIVSNPPYISSEEYEGLDKNVREYEPSIALLAGSDGLDVYRRIITQAHEFLKAGAPLMMEIGYRQAEDIQQLLDETNKYRDIKIEKDMQRNDRLVTAIRI